ncbi:PDZ and LIM domain protein Zasp isoform X2 [Bactrocera dorsalis]|uniref:PDZ and LIM domain protein Zasp isoform X2 n=2 Tax=Bactrocera dorsalis TaxID=27457 RepID=A0ABM3JHU2_BACDO|nr:PDZ and LIM domain protein Zasp isoform X2 [Bactrocera dorsalis]
MAQPQLLQIKLSRFDAQPWGFRLQGGVDFATPLVVQKVNGGSLAEKAGLIPGDAVLKINDVDVFNLRHKDAQDVVVRSGNNFVLTVQRGGSTWRPHVTPTGNIPQPQQNSPYLQTVTKTSLAHKQQESQHIGCGYNNAARPFANGGDGNVKSIVNKQYNTPVGIYSDESIAETLSAQAEVLAGGVLGVNFKKNEKEYQPDKSEVLKFLREEETGASTPEPPAPANFYWTQSHAIGGNERRTPLSHKHQQLIPEEQPKDDSTGTNLQENKLYASSAQRPSLAQPAKPSSSEPADPRVIIMPVCPALQGPEYKAEMEAAAAALQHDDGPRPLSASGHPACALCGVGIVGVFVRIKDKNLHVECFKCATCGTSLKNQGYYNYNNKLYCDIHAKLAALQNPPSGTDGYVPVPIKPNTKLSANTISSALNAHGFSEIPVANGGSVAPPTAPVAKPTATLDPPPPATPDSLSTTQASTAISSTIANSTLLNTTNNINSSNNNKESEQLEGATQSIHGKSTNFSSGMLANPSSALDTASNDQPFGEYVTLTGSVIRSVVPPGKGVNINYKINQGYARPFGAAPAVAPKSPVAYPPQRPAVNPYATLPRTNIGQQELCTKPTNANATLPHKVNSKMNRNISDAHQSDTDLQADGNATAMLTESIGLMNVGDKMENFMTEAGKIISNMLEARLANNRGTMPTSSHGGSTSSLRSNCSSNQSRSPMVIRKRFDLEDFKNVDPTLPVALKPVVTVQQFPEQNAHIENEITCQKANPEMFSHKELNTTFAAKLPTSHPMGKLLDICDNNTQNYTSTPQTVNVPRHTHATETDNSIKSAQERDVTSCQSNDIASASKPKDVIYREKTSGPLKQCSSQREGEISTHELDRRSYIEPTDLNVSDSAREGPAFSIHVRALGPKSRNNEGLPNAIMPPENEEVVSQLLKDGKRPICCQCNLEITKGPFITALGRIWCPEHFICVNANCRRPLQDIGFVEEKGDLYCEYCFEKYLAPTCSKCGSKIKGDCLNAIGKQFHPECFTCGHCGKLFGNTPFFLEDGNAYCEADWNELFTTKCFACGFPVEAGDRWVEALNHNYHSQCFNCTYCKQNLEGQSFYNKGGRPFCKNHAR